MSNRSHHFETPSCPFNSKIVYKLIEKSNFQLQLHLPLGEGANKVSKLNLLINKSDRSNSNLISFPNRITLREIHYSKRNVGTACFKNWLEELNKVNKNHPDKLSKFVSWTIRPELLENWIRKQFGKLIKIKIEKYYIATT